MPINMISKNTINLQKLTNKDGAFLKELEIVLLQVKCLWLKWRKVWVADKPEILANPKCLSRSQRFLH